MSDKTFGVIFDMDGVLVDSYQAHFESWRQLARELGLTITEEQFASTFGRTSREIIAALWGDCRFTDDEVRQLDARKEEIYRRIVAENFPVMDGALDLLRSLHAAGFRVAIGSSGPPENVELAIDKLGVRPLLDAVVTGADVTRGKPDPQVFLLCAERLGLPPHQCAVIEDSPYGVAAANAAGMTSVALTSQPTKPEFFSPPDLQTTTLRALSPERIAALISRKTEQAERAN